MLDKIKQRIQDRRERSERQRAINACLVPIDATLTNLAHELWPTCEAIRFREGICEWAIDSTHGWQWFPLSRLPKNIEFAVLDHIRNRGKK